MGRDLLKVLAACGPEGLALRARRACSGPEGRSSPFSAHLRARRARMRARRAREGERSETVVPEATD